MKNSINHGLKWFTLEITLYFDIIHIIGSYFSYVD